MTDSQIVHFEEKPGTPIACDLTGAGDTAEERLAEYGRLFAHALIDRARTSDAVVFTFAAKAGVAEWVADLARREAACCPFSTYDVQLIDDRVVWRTSSQRGPVVQAFLDVFHGLPDRVDGGVEGLRGAAIRTPPAP
jgi:hypothetical protein